MPNNPKTKTTVFIILIFLGGVLTGYLVELLIPLFDLSGLYEQLGFWDTIGRIGIIIFFFTIPLGYFLWIVMSLVQISRPNKPVENIYRKKQISQISQISRILVPFGDGPNVMLGLQLVSQLTNVKENGLITLFRILPSSMEKQVDQQKKHLETILHQSLLEYQKDFVIDIKIIVSNEVVKPIIDEAKSGHYELLVVGASERTSFGRFLFGSIPHQIAEQAPCPVLIIRQAANVNTPINTIK